VIGIYKGAQKPRDPNIYLEKFIADIIKIISNGGINFHGKKIPIRLRCFIADAPARTFILNHRGLLSLIPNVKSLGHVMKVVMYSMALIILFAQMKNILGVWTKIIIKRVEVH